MKFEIDEFSDGYFVTSKCCDTYREALYGYMKTVEEIIDKRIGCARIIMVEETEFGESYIVIHYFLYKDNLDRALRS